jgi:hypothetical protein
MSECIRHPGQWQQAVEIGGESVAFCSACVGYCADCAERNRCKNNYGAKKGPAVINVSEANNAWNKAALEISKDDRNRKG